jgi:regulator of RNase E activity RraA
MSADDTVQRFRPIGTSTLSDALDRLGLPGAVPGILPFNPAFALCGRAFTGQYEPVDAAGGTVGDYIDDVEPGQVVVLSNDGRLDCTVWGDILTYTASSRRVGGTVIEGVCRDVAASLETGYPVFARGRNMQTGKDRVRLAGTGRPVRLGAVLVRPGDVVCGDADGIVVVAADQAEQVLDAAEGIAAAEDRIRSAVAAGQRLDAARAAEGYHRLQGADTAR